ncbi:hypothetical protein EPN16_03225 [bacterium]|nr:MAG: hypothetical protein EPN16_03225 [bacterium]
MHRLRGNKAQSILEFALFSACLIAAFVVMATYVKRGIAGRLRSVSDGMGEQYDPGNTQSDITTSQESETSSITYPAPDDNPQDTEPGAQQAYFTVREDRIDKDITTRRGYEEVGDLKDGLFK